jgi:hypothetical protein
MIRAFLRIEFMGSDKTHFIIVDFDAAADCAGNHATASNHDNTILGGSGRASNEALFMLPLPTPAMTIPFAPFATDASIGSGAMSA